jgi:hypothetical protein
VELTLENVVPEVGISEKFAFMTAQAVIGSG